MNDEYLEDQADIEAAKEALAEVEAMGGMEACCLTLDEFFARLDEKERDEQ